MSILLGHKAWGNSEVGRCALGPWLLPGDEILALFDCNCLRPPADAIAVTSFRIGGVASTRSSANPSSRRRSGPHISGPATSKEQAAIPADDEMRFP